MCKIFFKEKHKTLLRDIKEKFDKNRTYYAYDLEESLLKIFQFSHN